MAYQKTRFKIKTSTVNSTPQPADLIPGELAFSEISGGLFIKYSDGTIQQINNGTGYYQTRWDLISGLIADNPVLSSALNAKQDLLVPASGITLVGGAISLNYAAIISNLNMGTAAFKDVGTGSDDVAAGNHTHTKFNVGLGNVDNTSDLAKPISTATQTALNAKADKTLASPITDGLMSKEDKSKLDGLDGSIGGADLSFVLDRANHTGTQAISTVSGLQTALDSKINVSAVSSYSLGVLSSANQSAFKTSIGLGNVDNTSDLSKPISSATQAALNAKQNVLTAGSNISIVGDTISVSGLSLTADWSSITNKPTTFAPSAHTHTKSEVGLANVDNTSDANKPISTATQAALDGKASNAVATTSVNGLMSSADKTKLNGIATNATANSTDAFLLSRTNHTGTQAISTVTGLQTALDGKVNAVAFSSYFLTLTTSANSNALKSLLDLDQVTNTNDLSKPISTATQTALNNKADKIAATTTVDGLMSASDKTKLNDVAFSATANSTDAFLLSRTNHTGTQAISTVTGLQTALDGKADKTNATGLQAGLMSPADKIKLDGVDTNATANSPDATLLDRANHTGIQAISTVTGLQTALDGKQATLTAGANISIVGDTISATIDGAIETDWTTITNKPTSFPPSAHTHTKSEVGLGNVDNTSDVAKPISIATQAALNQKVDISSISSYVLNNILGSTSASSIKTTISLNNVDNTSDLNKPISTATQAALNQKADTTVATTSANGLMAASDKIKLNGISTNATANSSDATLLNRANHTGTQAISTVTGLQTALDAKQTTLISGDNIKTVGGVSILGSGDIPVSSGGGSVTIVDDFTTGGSTSAASAETVKILKTQVDAKIDKATTGSTVTVSGNMSASHVGKVIVVDTSSAAIVMTLVPGVITSASDRITYKRKGGNTLSFAAANGATLNDPHLMQIVDGDLAVIAGTAIDTATVAGMPGDMVRKGRANLYTARQAIAPATLNIVSGNIAIDASLSNNFTLALTENATLMNPTALIGGQAGTIDVINSGSFALSFGTIWRPVVGATTSVKQGAGGFSMITFKVSADGTKILYNIIQEQ